MMPSGRREPWKNADGAKERKKEKKKNGSWAVRQTGRGPHRQADGKNKILEENQSSTPSWASLPIGQRGGQLEFRGGALPVRSKGRPPMWCLFVWVCVCTWLKKKNPLLQACFPYICGTHLRIPVHVKQHIHTGNVCVFGGAVCTFEGLGGVWRYDPVVWVVDQWVSGMGVFMRILAF